MIAAILILMVIPFTNTSSFRSGEFKPFFAVSF
jgi:hypothetical protein